MPRVVEEHDSAAGVVSSLEAGSGVPIAVDAYSYTFGHRINLVRLTPELKPMTIGIAARKGRLSPVA
jgi:hypothetical protein